MGFTFVASQMLVLALAIAVGFVARKLDVMNDAFDGSLSRLVLDVALPCMIVSSVFTEGGLPNAETIGIILGYSFAAYALMLVIGAVAPLLLGLPKSDRGVYSFMTSFGNVAFIGFPVLSAVFGPQAILYGAIVNIPFNLAVFTIGAAFIAQGEGGFLKRMTSNWRTLISPVQVSCLIAIVLALLGVQNGGVVGDALSTVGSLTTPAALLIVGSSLAKYSPKSMLDNWRAYVIAAFRLGVVPLAVYFVFHQFVSDPLLLGVMTITSAMPVATNGMLLCLKYGGNLKAMTQGTFISTVASILTIPCIAMLVV